MTNVVCVSAHRATWVAGRILPREATLRASLRRGVLEARGRFIYLEYRVKM